MGRVYAILGGTYQELRPVASALMLNQRELRKGFDLRIGTVFGVDCVAVVAGMGEERAMAATRFMIDTFSPAGVISIGFSGGLQEGIGVGTVVAADSVARSDTATGEAIPCDAGMLGVAKRTAGGSSLIVRTGLIICSNEVVRIGSFKRILGETTGGLAVDMESWGVAYCARERGVPYLAVRGVTDPIDCDVTFQPEDWIGTDGAVRFWRGIASLLRNPASIIGVARMGAGSLRASRALAEFTRRFFQILKAGGQGRASGARV